MLKPADEPMAEDERPIGEIVHQLIDEGKAYARAEFVLARAEALARLDRYKLPAILLGVAFLFAQAAVTLIGVAVAMGLAPLIGPFGAGAVAVLLTGGAAALLAWFALRKLGLLR